MKYSRSIPIFNLDDSTKSLLSKYNRDTRDDPKITVSRLTRKNLEAIKSDNESVDYG